MAYQHYTPEFMARLVLLVLQGEKELGEVANENNINPNLIRKQNKVLFYLNGTNTAENVVKMYEDLCK